MAWRARGGRLRGWRGRGGSWLRHFRDLERKLRNVVPRERASPRLRRRVPPKRVLFAEGVPLGVEVLCRDFEEGLWAHCVTHHLGQVCPELAGAREEAREQVDVRGGTVSYRHAEVMSERER